tara:strand:+ start:522 stop:653 length:132 start_codon:yes stop_codon:yes gene_type:complete
MRTEYQKLKDYEQISDLIENVKHKFKNLQNGQLKQKNLVRKKV